MSEVIHLHDIAPPPLVITVLGEPMGKPRMTQRDKWAKRDCVMRYRAWADELRLRAGNRVPAPEAIAQLDWTAYFEPPQSWSRKKRDAAMNTLHRSKPDRDNIDKAVLDALFKSDSAIASGTIEKRWGSPARLEIVIRVVDGKADNAKIAGAGGETPASLNKANL